MALNDSMTESSVALVNLYKALGGGWDPAAFSAADSDATR
jgi:outer membrane protein TolC